MQNVPHAELVRKLFPNRNGVATDSYADLALHNVPAPLNRAPLCRSCESLLFGIKKKSVWINDHSEQQLRPLTRYDNNNDSDLIH